MAEEPEQRSKLAGGCVLVVLAGVGVAALFATSETAGVLLLWAAAAVALWRSANRRVSDMPATPPPEEASPSGDVYTGETGQVARVEAISEGVAFIVHPVREETTPD